MELTITRERATGLGVVGTLEVGDFVCFTLERHSTLIPVGIYSLQLTVSARATEGELWSPDPMNRLPLIVVPGRSGIRIHAANLPSELEGCVAVGRIRQDDTLRYSRAALMELWRLLVSAPISTYTVDITDIEPSE